MSDRHSLTAKPGVAWQQARLSSCANGAGSGQGGSSRMLNSKSKSLGSRVMLCMLLKTMSLQPRLAGSSGWPPLRQSSVLQLSLLSC
jgi:hypothetical protein